MEVAGLVISAAGLAALFSCCSSAFQLIQRGRAFGHDYKILETKFSNQELRLRAWGRACGLIDGMSYDPRLDEPEIHCQLIRTLECISLLLSDAKALQDRYGVKPSTSMPSPSSPSSTTPSSITTPTSPGRLERRSSLNRFLKRRSKIQPNLPNHVATALWVIDDREKFSGLVKHLKDFIDDLEDLTRTTLVPRRQLVFIDYEIECISEIEVLEDIEAAREGDDDAVSDAASVRLELISQGTASIRSSLVSTNARSSATLESYFTARSHFSGVPSLHFSDVPNSRFSKVIHPYLDYTSGFSSAPNIFDVESVSAGKRLSRRLSMLEVPKEARSNLKHFYKCDVVGEAYAHKAELLSVYTHGHLPRENTLSGFERRVTGIKVGGKETGLILSDTAGTEEFPHEAGRMLSGADIVIICFLLGDLPKDGYVGKWRSVVTEYCPQARIFLAGIVLNCYTNDDTDPLYGKKLAAENNIPSYVQCHLEKGPSLGGVDDLFEAAIRAAILRDTTPRPVIPLSRFHQRRIIAQPLLPHDDDKFIL